GRPSNRRVGVPACAANLYDQQNSFLQRLIFACCQAADLSYAWLCIQSLHRGPGVYSQWVPHREIRADTMIFRRDGQLDENGSTGTITWEGLGSAEYSFDRRGPDEMTVRLNYVAGPEDSARFVSEVLSLTPTYPHLGGRRWWFCCPGCNGRARKVYLPPEHVRFRCRRCHQLSFRSSQESHTFAEFARRFM